MFSGCVRIGTSYVEVGCQMELLPFCRYYFICESHPPQSWHEKLYQRFARWETNCIQMEYLFAKHLYHVVRHYKEDQLQSEQFLYPTLKTYHPIKNRFSIFKIENRIDLTLEQTYLLLFYFNKNYLLFQYFCNNISYNKHKTK